LTRIEELELALTEKTIRLDELLSRDKLAKRNYDLMQDILAVCEERDKYKRKIEQLQEQVKKLISIDKLDF